MLRISIYILKQLIFPFFVSVLGILFLFILSVVMREMPKFAGKGLDPFIILEFLYLSVGWILILAVPMGVLVSTIWVHSRLSQDNEWAIMQASGISIYQVLLPSIIIFSLMSFFMLYFNNNILPEMNHQSKVLKHSISRKKPSAIIEEGTFVSDIPGYMIKADSVDYKKNIFWNIIIIESSINSESRRTITARKGSIIYDRNISSYVLSLEDGFVDNFEKDKRNSYQHSKYHRMQIIKKVKGIDFEKKENDYYGDREKSAEELREKIAHLEKNGGSSNRIASVKVELYKKYALAYACLFMSIIGIPLGLMSGKSGMGASSLLGIVIFVIYWFFLIAGEDYADRGFLNPLLSMWNANIIAGSIGIILIYKASHGSKLSFIFIRNFIGKIFEVFTKK